MQTQEALAISPVSPVMTTDVEVEHILEWLGRAVVGENMWNARIADGINLAENMIFLFEEVTDAATSRSATALVVIGEGETPSTQYQLPAGRYQLTEITHRLNQWFAQAVTDLDITTYCRLGLTTGADGLVHGQLTYKMDDCINFKIQMPFHIHRALGTFGGFTTVGGPFGPVEVMRAVPDIFDTSVHREASVNGALRSIIHADAVSLQTFEIEAESGDLYDQSASLPGALEWLFGPQPFSGEAAFCLLQGLEGEESLPCAVVKDGTTIRHLRIFDPQTAQPIPPEHVGIGVPWDAPQGALLTQFIYVNGPFWQVLCRLFYSTGTTGYNHPDHDVYPASIGLAIPGELLRDLEPSARALPHADLEMPILITRPTKLADLIGGEMQLRFAFFRFGNGGPIGLKNLDPVQQRIADEGMRCSRENPRPLRLPFVMTDAGRAAAGFGPWNDCVVRALAIGLNASYWAVHGALKRAWLELGNGVPGFTHPIVARVLEPRGWQFVHTWSRFGHKHFDDLPKTGRIIVSSMGHSFAMVNGVIHDHVEGGQAPTAEDTPCQCAFSFWAHPDVPAEEIERARVKMVFTTPPETPEELAHCRRLAGL